MIQRTFILHSFVTVKAAVRASKSLPACVTGREPNQDGLLATCVHIYVTGVERVGHLTVSRYDTGDVANSCPELAMPKLE